MLDILIKLDFFHEFGDPNTLLWVAQQFDQLYGKKSIKKDSPLAKYIENMPTHPYTSETPTHVDEIDVIEFFRSRGITDIQEMGELMDDCQKFKYVEKDGVKTKVPTNIVSYTKMWKKFNVTEEEKRRFATKTVYGKYDGINVRQILKHMLDNSKYPPVSVHQRIKWEQELLGYIDYTDPTLDKRYFVVTQLDTKYSPKFMAYCINNGRSVEMRVRKTKGKNPKLVKTFESDPFCDGDVLFLKSWGKEAKMKKVGDNWEKDTSTMINWMYDWEVTEL